MYIISVFKVFGNATFLLLYLEVDIDYYTIRLNLKH